MKELARTEDLAAAAMLGYELHEAESKIQKADMPNAKPFLLINQAVVYLDEVFDKPARKTGTIAVNDAESLLLAWERYKNDKASVIYGSLTPGAFTAVFNDHAPLDGDAGYRDHRALYTLKHSKEWVEWHEHNGAKNAFTGNDDFAFFIEGHIPDIIKPTGGEMLKIATNFKAKSTGTYRNNMNIQSGSISLEWVEQVDASASVAKVGGGTEKIQIPETFTIEIPVYEGVNQPVYKIDAKFRFRVGSGGIKIWYDLMQPHKAAEAAFKAVWSKIEDGAGSKIILGSPAPT